MDKDKRNQGIYAAHVRYGYSLKKVGECIGIHYSAASKVLKKMLHEAEGEINSRFKT
ncbi:MAG: hypothetical protein J7L53_00635 [Deltaproteobacteria bacterium]|nr:hypothetical protein [Deltaproteobacteria bacterium]